MDFLSGESAKADLSRFEKNAVLADGDYELDVYINHEWRGRLPVIIKDNNHSVLMTAAQINDLGIKLNDKEKKYPDAVPLSDYLQEGSYQLDLSQFKLNIQVPQAQLIQGLQGYIAPEYWERGISGAFVSYSGNYSYSKYNNSADSKNNDNVYLSLNSGVNLLGWQFRDQSTYNYDNQSGSDWINNNRYIQKGLPSISSEIRLGDSYSKSDMFDSIFFRGMTLKTDMRMYPDAMQGFSPVVRGVAQSNATVNIYQNNTLIYQTTVPPGAFTIEDILPTGSGGDLSVEVKEANGSVNQFIVPFSSVPNMLKEGVTKYELYAGEARINSNHYRPNFIQGGYQLGINNTLTGYTGGIASDNYYSVLLGGGFNLPIGAISIDMSHAQSRFDNNASLTGQSYKVSYSRYFNQTGTNFSLAAYRYSTKDYLTFSDSIELREWLNSGNSPSGFSHQKNTFNINMSQDLGENVGSLFISGTLRDYWGENNSSKEYQIGYSNSWNSINYSITTSRIRYSNNDQNSHLKEEQRYYFNVSIPISLFEQSAYLSAGSNFNDGTYANSNVGLSGVAGENNQINYGATVSDQNKGSTSLNTNLSYKTSVATLNSSFSHSSDYTQMTVGATGSIVAVKQGVLASNQLGETFAIIDVPGVKNAAINGDKTLITNDDGVALVPYLSAYRKNMIRLDTEDTDSNTEVVGNMKDIVPYAGAITYIPFQTDNRQNYILKANKADGNPLPFGTEVINEEGENIGYVGQSSLLFLRADTLPEAIYIKINGYPKGRCVIHNPIVTLEKQKNICVGEE
ncbi:fimbria/pilus outer membrane usher protein [Providencia sneebia]|uniref:Outer membrane usher protein n=1 Tax=Providencia sneebia DSM 19967 TaxID=1141660 RepID=K8WK01_9GAMM|nr:fimbria/pilus outer membrane usher protein [Providencia sneebia]EKT60923.1 outer membrane usher protein [Providencia sneebia DSM 19967]